MYGYGISYAIASLSCTIGPFLAVTSASLRAGALVGRFSVNLAYVGGLSLVVGVLAVAAAFASTAIADRLRRVVPLLNRISGVLLVVVGLYVGYYGLSEVRLRRAASAASADPVISAVAHVQGALLGWVHTHGGWPWVLMLVMLMAGAWYRRRAGRRRST